MPLTSEQAKKVAAEKKLKDPHHFENIGLKGGEKKHPNKGFASMSKEKRLEISKKGGSLGKRGKAL